MKTAPRRGEQDRGLIVATAIGPCRLTWSDRGLTAISLLSAEDPRAALPDAADPPAWVRDAADQLARHLAGDAQDLTGIPLDPAGLPPFHVKVYEAARRVGPGRTVTYGAIAAEIGGSARAVGQALARNPWFIVVPCHRVLAAGGAPGGFSAPGGRDTKARLLAIEGAGAAADAGAGDTRPRQLTLPV